LSTTSKLGIPDDGRNQLLQQIQYGKKLKSTKNQMKDCSEPKVSRSTETAAPTAGTTTGNMNQPKNTSHADMLASVLMARFAQNNIQTKFEQTPPVCLARVNTPGPSTMSKPSVRMPQLQSSPDLPPPCHQAAPPPCNPPSPLLCDFQIPPICNIPAPPPIKEISVSPSSQTPAKPSSAISEDNQSLLLQQIQRGKQLRSATHLMKDRSGLNSSKVETKTDVSKSNEKSTNHHNLLVEAINKNITIPRGIV